MTCGEMHFSKYRQGLGRLPRVPGRAQVRLGEEHLARQEGGGLPEGIMRQFKSNGMF